MPLESWRDYQHPSARFSLKHPEEWRVLAERDRGLVLALGAPQEQERLFTPNVTVMIQALDRQMDLDGFSEEALAGLELTLTDAAMQGDLREVTMAGSPGREVAASFPLRGPSSS